MRTFIPAGLLLAAGLMPATAMMTFPETVQARPCGQVYGCHMTVECTYSDTGEPFVVTVQVGPTVTTGYMEQTYQNHGAAQGDGTKRALHGCRVTSVVAAG